METGRTDTSFVTHFARRCAGAWKSAASSDERLKVCDTTGTADHVARLEEMLGAMTAEEGPHVPGEGKHQARAVAERDGVEVDAALAGMLKSLGARL